MQATQLTGDTAVDQEIADASDDNAVQVYDAENKTRSMIDWPGPA